MAQYIDKATLVAEIEKRQKEEVFCDEDGSFASWADENYYSTNVSRHQSKQCNLLEILLTML